MQKIITNTLVRDKVPKQIAAQGSKAVITKLVGADLQFAIRKKLAAFVAELSCLDGKESIPTLAEIQTLLDAYCKELGISATELSKAMGNRRHEFGDYTQGQFMFYESPSDIIEVVASLSK